jgi:hypothetical protein
MQLGSQINTDAEQYSASTPPALVPDDWEVAASTVE